MTRSPVTVWIGPSRTYTQVIFLIPCGPNAMSAEQAKLWLTRTKVKMEEANRLAEEAEHKVSCLCSVAARYVL